MMPLSVSILQLRTSADISTQQGLTHKDCPEMEKKRSVCRGFSIRLIDWLLGMSPQRNQ